MSETGGIDRDQNPYQAPSHAAFEQPKAAPSIVASEGSPWRYGIVGLLAIMAMVAYVQRFALSVPLKEIATDLGIEDIGRQMGNVQFIWFFCYAAMQLPSGWFVDRVGSRLAILLFCFIWSVATAFSGLASGYTSLMILWGCMGAAQAGAFPCATKAISQTFPDGERARGSALLTTGMMLGASVAPTLTAILLRVLQPTAALWETERWRLVFLLYAIPGVLWVILFWFSVPASQLPVASPQAKGTRHVAWFRYFADPSLLLLYGQQFFRAAGMVFFNTWFPTFLQETRNFSTSDSGYLTTVVNIGTVVGVLLGGFCSDGLLAWTKNSRLSRQGMAVVGISASAALFLAAYFVANVHLCIALLTLGALCVSFGGVSGYTMAISLGGKQVATVFSIMNMCGNLGAALFPLIAGRLVNLTGDWNSIIFLYVGIMAIDAVCWGLLNPKETLFEDEVDGATS
jgi:ACS family D-galactonate transporter-like MFS transporter